MRIILDVVAAAWLRTVRKIRFPAGCKLRAGGCGKRMHPSPIKDLRLALFKTSVHFCVQYSSIYEIDRQK